MSGAHCDCLSADGLLTTDRKADGNRASEGRKLLIACCKGSYFYRMSGSVGHKKCVEGAILAEIEDCATFRMVIILGYNHSERHSESGAVGHGCWPMSELSHGDTSPFGRRKLTFCKVVDDLLAMVCYPADCQSVTNSVSTGCFPVHNFPSTVKASTTWAVAVGPSCVNQQFINSKYCADRYFSLFLQPYYKTKDMIRFLLITAMSLMTLSGHAQENVYSFQIQR